MRKITILEVWDPVKKEFVPIRQAINQGLFSPKTYLFFSPTENKHYSITEAAKRGIFKSAIDLRPEALIVERVKVAETVSLHAARDPENGDRLINIKEAIARGIVDPNMRIYRNTTNNTVVDLGDAIDLDLVQVKILRETTEKITETLTEQKTNSENLCLIKKIETRNIVSENEAPPSVPVVVEKSTNHDVDRFIDDESLSKFDEHATPDEHDGALQQLNDDMFLFDRTVSYNVSKRMRKYNDEVAAGFISDQDSKKFINQSQSARGPSQTADSQTAAASGGLNSRILVPIVDFNDAVNRNLVILPDSMCLTQNVEYVLDLNTGNKFDYDAACEIGLIDVNSKKYYDTRTNKAINLFEALEKNYIVMKDELSTNYDENEKNVSTIRKLTKADLKTLFNPKTGNQVPVSKAVELGIYDKARNVYVDIITRRVMTLEDAVEKGLVVLKREKFQNKVNEGYQYLNINGIYDPISKTPMSLNEAIENGFLDYTECELHDPNSGKTLTLLEAYDKGLLITTAKSVTSAPLSVEIADTSRQVLSADETASNLNDESFAQEAVVPLNARMASQPPPPPAAVAAATAIHSQHRSRRDEIELKRLHSVESNNGTIHNQTDEHVVSRAHVPASSTRLNDSFDTAPRAPARAARSQSPVQRRRANSQRSLRTNNNKQRTTASLDGKSIDRLSVSSRRSVVLKIKDKFFGRKSKSNVFDERLINESARVIDTRSNDKYSIEDAAKMGLLFGENLVKDTSEAVNLSVKVAIEQGVIKFFHPINQFEFKYNLSCAIFNDVLLLINYVIDPMSKRKIGLKNALFNLVIDRENSVFYSKKGPIKLYSAIEKGHICCEIIDLNTLNDIIASKIFHHHVDEVEPASSAQPTDYTQAPSITSRTMAVASDPPSSGPVRDETTVRSLPETDRPVAQDDSAILKNILRNSNMKLDRDKNYVVSEVLDAKTDRFVSYKRACREGIINLAKNEYTDTKQNIRLDIVTAIRSKKIKLDDLNSSMASTAKGRASQRPTGSQMKLDLNTSNELDIDILSSSNYPDLDSSLENLGPKSTGRTTGRANGRKTFASGQADELDASSLRQSTLKNSYTMDDRQMSRFSNYDTKSERSEFGLKSAISAEPLTYDSFRKPLDSKINGYEDETETDANESSDYNFNLPKCLLYKKASNGKYIRFDTVVKNKLYDAEQGKVKDSFGTEYIGIIDALLKGVLRINDPNFLFDESRVYYVNSVLHHGRKISLGDAVVKSIIDKKKCLYASQPNKEHSVKDAIRLGYIEGKVLTSYEIKWMLDNYARKVEAKYSLTMSSNKSLNRIDNENDEDEEPVKEKQQSKRYDQSNKLMGIPLESFDEFFVFDPDSEKYIELSKAFYSGIVLNEPVRIKDPSSSNYILFKDAVIKGLISCQKSDKRINLKDRSSFYTFNRKSYIIDFVYDPKKNIKFSLQEAIRTRIFVNGIYKNYIRYESYQIDEAIEKGFIIGKQVDIENIQTMFRSSLALENDDSTTTTTLNGRSRAPTKPSRGIFVGDQPANGDANGDEFETEASRRNRSKSAEKRKRINQEEAIIKSQIDTYSGKILLVQDLMTSKYLKPDEAEKIGLINFLNGTYENSLTNERMKINEAIECGYILIEKFKNENQRQRSLSSNRRKPLKPTGENTFESYDDMLNSTRVEMNQQFEIISVLDPVRKLNLELDEAIDAGLFDVASAMYIDPRNGKKLTMIDAIDQGLIKIANKNFRTSYKLTIEELDKNFVKNIRSFTIRYVIDPFNAEIIPINVAVLKDIVNLDNGTYTDEDEVITFKEAYERGLALTVDDLNNAESKRVRFFVNSVRKSTTGKVMSLKSALAKSWLNQDRRVYIDKQTNEEMPYSQAVDLDLLVLKVDKTAPVSSSTISRSGGNDLKSNNLISRSKSRDSFNY